MDRQKKATAILALIAALVIGWSVVSHANPAVSRTNTVADSSPIVVHHSVAAGLHTYRGEIQLPNDCAALTTGMGVVGQKPPQITLKFQESNTLVCPDFDAVASQFSVSFKSASGQAPELASVLMNNAGALFVVVEDK